MDNFVTKLDDFGVALWVETAGLVVFMSLMFLLTIKLF
jgi:hypothetical protein